MSSYKTQKDIVLDYLKKHKTITSRECMLELDIMDLQKAIQLLRDEGEKITDEWKKSPNKKKYKVYKLEEV